MKLKSPNPLFERWLTEWRDEAIEKNSKMQHSFTRALASLKRCPMPLVRGRDCLALKGFGKQLCRMLDDKLEREGGGCTQAAARNVDILNGNKKVKVYVPAYRSGSYAILITMYHKSLDPSYEGFMRSKDIIKHAQHLCDTSFVRPDPGSYYTAWSSMRILVDKELIVKKSSPAKYYLTDSGSRLAQKLELPSADNQVVEERVEGDSSSSSKEDTRNTKEEICSSQASSSSTSAIIEEETFILPPNSFDIILLVDNQETASVLNDVTRVKLSSLDVVYQVRNLKVGDYAWVAKEKGSNRELVLPYIVERKRMDDLGSSIKDGRYYEQKSRLKQCGIPNVTYVIESFGKNTHTGLPLTTLYQAATNTLIHDKFVVKFTDGLNGTVLYLACFTRLLTDMYKDKTLVSCPKENLSAINIEDDLISLMVFNEFNKAAAKQSKFTVKEMFMRQLLKLKGVSVERAMAIVAHYPTPKILKMAYDACSGSSGETLLAPIKYGNAKRNIGMAISRTVFQLYTKHTF